MKAVRFHEYGGAEVLRYEDAPLPEPGAGEVRVRVAGAAFNPVDDGIRGGYLQQNFPVALPHTPGIEVSGSVDALGEGVDTLATGDAVIAFLPMAAPGSAAEFVVAPSEVFVAAPTTVPLADAAALPLVALTAWQALFDHGALASGQRILINGAGGAVGSYAVQLAKAAGAHVIATASPRSEALVRAAGADEVIDHTAGPVTTAEPVDVLLNLARVSPDAFQALIPLVRDGGAVVNTVPGSPIPDLADRGLRAAAVFARSDAAQLREIVARVDRGELSVRVDERLPLSELPALHARFAAGEPISRAVATLGAV